MGGRFFIYVFLNYKDNLKISVEIKLQFNIKYLKYYFICFIMKLKMVKKL